MLAVRIAAADTVDAEELAALAARTFPLACPPSVNAKNIAAFIDANLSVARFADYVADPARVILTAHRDDQIVGYTMLVHGVTDDADIQRAVKTCSCDRTFEMYVVPEEHGSGVSTALMKHALAAAADTGMGCMWLGVNQNNQRAQRFYAKHGFTVTGNRTFRLGVQIRARLRHGSRA